MRLLIAAGRGVKHQGQTGADPGHLFLQIFDCSHQFALAASFPFCVPTPQILALSTFAGKSALSGRFQQLIHRGFAGNRILKGNLHCKCFSRSANQGAQTIP